jgi:hypothetical protein
LPLPVYAITVREGKEECLDGKNNKVLRRMFGTRGEEVTGGWRKLRDDEFHNSYSSPSIIRMIKSRRIRWAGHVARGG